MRTGSKHLTGAHLRTLLPPAIWSAALVYLFSIDPARSTFSLCLFRLLGFSRCPGCGLGHAIHYALHLDLRQSVQAHVLGVPATLVIVYTIFSSLHHFTFFPKWTNNNYS